MIKILVTQDSEVTKEITCSSAIIAYMDDTGGQVDMLSTTPEERMMLAFLVLLSVMDNIRKCEVR